jgi:hypothetical protein
MALKRSHTITALAGFSLVTLRPAACAARRAPAFLADRASLPVLSIFASLPIQIP